MSVLLGTSVAQASLDNLAQRAINQSYNLQQAINDFQYGGGNKQKILNISDRLRNTLDLIEQKVGVGGGGGVALSASCNLDVGGNFFTPWTKVECTVSGKKAVSYEVEVNGRVRFSGPLNPNLLSQSFKTKKEEVGGHGPTYQVFIRTKNGQRKLVATL